MEFSKETSESIRQFAKEQAEKHLSNAEISYFEQLNRKGEKTKDKIGKQMSKFKMTSTQTLEARDDFTLYMSDYMSDLIQQGYTEKEALELAKKALAADSQSDEATDIQDKYMQYYLSKDPAVEEIIGLFYAGFIFLGIILGAVIGLFLGIKVFPEYFILTIILSATTGLFIGIAFGLLKHASIIQNNK